MSDMNAQTNNVVSLKGDEEPLEGRTLNKRRVTDQLGNISSVDDRRLLGTWVMLSVVKILPIGTKIWTTLNCNAK
jgi:hypothetical protein